MADEGMALIDLFEKQADHNLEREMLAFAVERIMEAEVGARTGAAGAARLVAAEGQGGAVFASPPVQAIDRGARRAMRASRHLRSLRPVRRRQSL